jgi:hypothetical protein
MYSYPYSNPAEGYPTSNNPGSYGYPSCQSSNTMQPVPPPVPVYGNNQSYVSNYGPPAPSIPSNHNFSVPAYGGNPMMDGPYSHGNASTSYNTSPPMSTGHMIAPVSHSSSQPYASKKKVPSKTNLVIQRIVYSRLCQCTTTNNIFSVRWIVS